MRNPLPECMYVLGPGGSSCMIVLVNIVKETLLFPRFFTWCIPTTSNWGKKYNLKCDSKLKIMPARQWCNITHQCVYVPVCVDKHILFESVQYPGCHIGVHSNGGI